MRLDDDDLNFAKELSSKKSHARNAITNSGMSLHSKWIALLSHHRYHQYQYQYQHQYLRKITRRLSANSMTSNK
jgi:hypothetical protein